MRCFLCAFDQDRPAKDQAALSEAQGGPVEKQAALILGVPEDAVTAIMIYSEEVTSIVNQDEEGNTFFSLPHFFGLTNQTIRHGIVLKPLVSGLSGCSGLPQNDRISSEPEEGLRNILLVSSVEREVDIAPEDIYPLPELLLTLGSLSFFTGISFVGDVMIALIDPVSLVARILQDTIGGTDGRTPL